MFFMKNSQAAIAFVFAALLTASPLVAASKTKHAAPAKKAHVAATSTHTRASANAKSSKEKASSQAKASNVTPVKSSSHNSTAVSARHSRKTTLKTVAAKAKPRGQQSIDSARTLEIQQALIRERYLDGEPTGEWDQATRNALLRLQEENHWQTKIIPDSRALIKLGLGPSQQNLLNPESAAIAPSFQSRIQNYPTGGSN